MIIDTNASSKKRRLEEKESDNSTKINKKNAVLLLVLCIILIIIIICFQIYKNYHKNFNYLKEDKSEYLVYTRYNQNDVEVPYINIESSNIKKINDQIVDYCNKYISLEKVKITYEYSLNGNFLSVIIKVINSEEEIDKLIFKTYNINLKTRSILQDKELLDYFKVDDKLISASIHNKFVDMYNDEVKKGYIEEALCDYECFLGFRGVEDYLDNLSYAIKDGKLTVYKPFIYTSIFGEENYFTEESFIFPIK